MTFKRKILVALALGVAIAARAGEDEVKFHLEPVVGYERVQEFSPYAHTNMRFFYGALVTAGVPHLSLEAEYTQGQDSEDFPGLGTQEQNQSVKLGVRSIWAITDFLSGMVRGGAAATRTRYLAWNGAGAQIENYQAPWTYNPYAGAGLRLWLSTRFALTLDEVVIFTNNISTLSQSTYQTSAGMEIRLP